MSSGRFHTACSIASAVVISPLISAGLGEAWPGVYYAFGNLLGILLSPDLDQEQITISEAIVMNVPILGHLFRFYFYPYAWRIPHRSFLSHFPVIGTVLRLLYICFPPFVLLFFKANDELYTFLTTTLPDIFPQLFYVFSGLLTSDFLHWFTDLISSLKSDKF